MTRGTLGTPLGGRDNALNFLRLVLAGCVVVGHTWPLGGFGRSAWEDLAGLAVGGFFALSGFLIAGSRMRLGGARFLWHRTLRIMPGYWVCLLVVAFVWSPLASAASGEHWRGGSAAQYVGTNAFLHVHQWGIDDTLTAVPSPRVWDGSLWTLEYEYVAYLGAATLLTLAVVRRAHTYVLPSLAVLACLALPLAHGPLGVTSTMLLDGLRLGSFFVVGMALWSLREILPASPWLALGSAAVVGWFATHPSAVGAALLTVPLAYLLLWLGGRLPIRIGVDNDLSYGVYIYAFPVQQTLALAGAPAVLGFWGSVVAAVALTLPLAWASWALVERPALRLKNLGRRRPVPSTIPLAASA